MPVKKKNTFICLLFYFGRKSNTILKKQQYYQKKKYFSSLLFHEQYNFKCKSRKLHVKITIIQKNVSPFAPINSRIKR
jgi:hypothetical protein